MVNLPTMGSRGQGWVWGQFALILAVIIASATGPGWPIAWLKFFGLMLAVAGGLLGMWSLGSLGDALTPFPKPRDRARLVEHGPYAVVRHPVYSALLLAMLGICLTGSWWGLLPLAVLVGWWLAKATVEEGFLRQQYPDYDAYCQRVRYRLIPFLV